VPHISRIGRVGLNTSQYGSQYRIVLKNLSYESYYTKNDALYQNVPIEIIRQITISVNSNNTKVGSPINLSIVYTGVFNFNIYNSTPFIKNTIDIQYFGYYENGSTDMLVYNNKPNATKYFIENASPISFQPAGTFATSALGMKVRLTPTEAAANKTWIFCGGFFETFSNNTGWVGIFNNKTFARETVENSTVINKLSNSCVKVKVYG